MSYIANQVISVRKRVEYEGVLRASHLNKLSTLVTLANHNNDEEALSLVSDCIDPDNTVYYNYKSKKRDREFTNRFNYIVEVLNY